MLRQRMRDFVPHHLRDLLRGALLDVVQGKNLAVVGSEGGERRLEAPVLLGGDDALRMFFDAFVDAGTEAVII